MRTELSVDGGDELPYVGARVTHRPVEKRLRRNAGKPTGLHHLIRAILVVALPFAASEVRASPPTGQVGRGLEHLDELMIETVKQHKLPGAAMAICKDGKLVFARGYGFANLKTSDPMTPVSRFNLASCTKPFTAAAVLRLVDDGKLNLDDQVFRRLEGIKLPDSPDSGFYKITARHLLYHTSGLPRDPKGPRKVDTLEEFISHALPTKLESAPGVRSNYSNFGYLVLRLVVNQAAGEDYEKYTINKVLTPAGAGNMRLSSNRGEFFPGEVQRYLLGRPEALQPGQNLPPDGGSWVASPIEVMRFMTALDGSRGSPLISKRSYQQMLMPPGPPYENKQRDRHPGLGWDAVQNRGKNALVYHKNGGIPGIATYMEHLPGGVDWCILFNASSGGSEDKAEGWRPPIIMAVAATTKWPAIDLFSKYPQ
jgi:N-acyl-D-amino-acid deacylase